MQAIYHHAKLNYFNNFSDLIILPPYGIMQKKNDQLLLLLKTMDVRQKITSIFFIGLMMTNFTDDESLQEPGTALWFLVYNLLYQSFHFLIVYLFVLKEHAASNNNISDDDEDDDLDGQFCNVLNDDNSNDYFDDDDD